MWRVIVPTDATPFDFFKAAEAAGQMPKAPCLLDIEVCCQIPKEWEQSEQNRAWANIIWPIDGPDLSVLEALIMPAFVGTPICQVVKRKHYSNAPRIIVCLTPL